MIRLCASFLSTLLFLLPVCSAELLLDRVMASIEGEPITYSEVLRFAHSKGAQIETLDFRDPQVQEVVQALVVKKLLDKEAESLGIAVSDDEIQAYLAEIQRQNNVDEATFRTLLEERGMSWVDYLSQVRSDIIKNRVVSARVRAKVNVVDEDIQRYLDNQPALKPARGARRVFLIPLGIADESLAKEQREDLASRLNSGAKFDPGVLVQARAQDLGYLISEDVKESIREVLEQTADATLSEPVEESGQFVLYYVVGTITDEKPVDPILEDEITAKVYEVKFSERLKEFIDIELPKRYHVEQL